MLQSTSRPLRFLALVITLTVGLQACAGSRAAKQEKSAAKASAAQTDMTRPPQTIGVEREVVVEQNPNETISFEEWKRRQEAGASADSSDE